MEWFFLLLHRNPISYFPLSFVIKHGIPSDMRAFTLKMVIHVFRHVLYIFIISSFFMNMSSCQIRSCPFSSSFHPTKSSTFFSPYKTPCVTSNFLYFYFFYFQAFQVLGPVMGWGHSWIRGKDFIYMAQENGFFWAMTLPSRMLVLTFDVY